MFNNSTPFTMPVAPVGYGYSNSGGFGGFGNDWIGLIVILAILGWGNGGLGLGNFGGGNGGYSEVQRGFDNQSVLNKLNGLENGLCDGFYSQNTTMLQGFNGLQQTIMTGFHGVDNDICNLGYNIQNGFNTLGHQLADCCCENRAAIAQVRYDMATQACDTRHAIQDSTRQILDFLTTDKISALQAENASLKQNAFFNAALDARTAEIIRRTGNDCPIPAYVVQPPAQVTFPTNGCGTFAGYGGYGGCGCGC